MGWSSRDEEGRADYERDSRKADWRLGDPLSLACTAEEAVLLIKAAEFKAALDLLEAYADAKAAKVRLEAVAAGAHP